MNYREKIISNNIAFCRANWKQLGEWEQKFVDSVDGQSYSLTQKQFNKLQDVAQNLADTLIKQ